MAGWTNRGKYKVAGWAFRSEAQPTNFYIALTTSTSPPTVNTNTFSQINEIAAGNGYTAGGISINLNSADFDTWTQDQTNTLALVAIKDIVWTASGGTIPASGDGARWAIMTDDNGTLANREVYHFWDLTSNTSASNTQTLTLQDLIIRLKES